MDEWIDLSLMITACGFSATCGFVVGYAFGHTHGWRRAESYYGSCVKERVEMAIEKFRAEKT
jgi:hypothetical protein